MHSPRTSHSIKQHQRGAVLMIMLVIMVMGVVAFFVSSLSSSALRVKQDEVTADALAQAKVALIGYAVTYGDTHPAVNGYLPCPDSGLNEGHAAPGCGTQNVSQIGRLPWHTLGLPPLRDASGECLWYAVAGTYKNSPKTDLMNWDNNGQFLVFSASGVIATGQTPDSNAVAVVFAPGAALSSQGQNRAPDGTAPICGGNYTASNYLDSDAAISANNSQPSAVANALSQFFTAGASANINDRVIFITKSDIFNAIKRRNDFAPYITNALNSIATSACLAALPAPVSMTFNNPISPFTTQASGGTTIASLVIGRVPQACLASPPLASPVDDWQDNLLYAKCASGLACLTVNGTTCKGVVIFSGEQVGGQTRITNAQKNTMSNYLEDAPSDILTAFTSGNTTFTGAVLYSAGSPSTDILACIP